jgi:Fungal specific transcription factor domain
MELLHHYTTLTSLTLSKKADLQRVCRIDFPQQAFSHEFLMHGLLTLAAVHQSHLQPENRIKLISEATKHHTKALSQGMLALSNMNESNCQAAVGFACLLLTYHFGLNQDPKAELQSPSGGKASITIWISLIRGITAVTYSAVQSIQGGSMSSILLPASFALPSDYSENDDDHHLLELRNFCSPTDLDSPVYLLTIELLRKHFVFARSNSRNDCEVRAIIMWAAIIPQEFIVLLEDLQPRALVILAHYCVLLKSLDSYWWLEGWPKALVYMIYCTLDTDWRCWIKWPLEVLL